MIEAADRIVIPAPRRRRLHPVHRPAATAAEPAHLIGRQAEVAAVRAALDRALAGTSQLVEVTGDPGIGKTALLTAVGAIAQRQSVPVAAPAGLDQLLAGGPAAAGDSRLAAERALLRGRSTPDGLVVCLDDMHHGDDRTIALIADLLARPLRAPLLLVYAYRHRQASLTLRTVAEQRGVITRLPLGPLTEAECAQFTGAVTRSRLRDLRRDSHGIPLYLRALTGQSAVERTTLLAELGQLSPNARRAVSAAAVLGGEIEPGTVAAVAELPESAQYTVFDELCRHDLVRPVPGTGRFSFRHPLLTDAVYQATEPGWRLAAHSTAARILSARHAPAQLIAPHVVRVAAPGTADPVAILVEAAATVRDQSPQTAVQWLDAANGLLPDRPGSQDMRADLLLERALTLGAAGRAAEARETIHAAIALLPPPLTAQRLRAVSFCSQLERVLAHRSEALALLRRELDDASPGGPYSAVLMAELAGNELVDRQLDAARLWAARALLAARACGARPVEAAGHGVLAMAHCLDGDVAEASAELARATSLLDGLLDSELAILPETAIWIGWAELMLGRPWDALRHVDRALTAGPGAAHPLGVAYLLIARVVILATVGRFTDAGTTAEELAELAVTTGAETLQAVAAVVGAWVGVWTGDDPAAPYLPAGSQVELDGFGWFAVIARGMRAEARLGAGDPAGCAALLLAEGPRLPAADAWSRARWYELLTRSALAQGHGASAQGHTGPAREWAAMAASAAARFAVPGMNGVALLATAQVQAVSDPSAAAVTADLAAAECTSGGGLSDARRASVVAATARVACDQVESARAQLAELQTAFEQGGALRLARQMAGLKMRVVNRTRLPGGPKVLTARERQVAALVAEGASNRQIARRLDVKEKTVEMHLSRVFVKLGVVNRVGVAREFDRSVRQEQQAAADV
jgi:DNA-binding CsgD family transcriptional regulator/tetratricopeptide (TPR) repeat protein